MIFRYLDTRTNPNYKYDIVLDDINYNFSLLSGATTGTTSNAYLPLSGGTVTGVTTFTARVTGDTLTLINTANTDSFQIFDEANVKQLYIDNTNQLAFYTGLSGGPVYFGAFDNPSAGLAGFSVPGEVISSVSSIDKRFGFGGGGAYFAITGPKGLVEIRGKTDEVQLIVQASSGQNQNVIEVRDTSENPMLVVDKNGRMSASTISATTISATTYYGVVTGTTLSKIGNSTYSTVQHLMDSVLSSGWHTGGEIYSAGTNTIGVSGGTGFIKATDSDIATQSFFDWTGATSINIPTDTTRYIGVSYSGGNPQIAVRTTEYSWDLDTEFSLGRVTNENGQLYIVDLHWDTSDAISNLIERFDSLALFSRDNRIGGLILGETGTRNVTVSAGSIMARMEEYSIAAIDTSVSSTFSAYYRTTGSTFNMQSAQTQWNNTQYDDGTGTLATLAAGRYTSRWFYLMTDNTLAMIYGQSQTGSISTALDDAPPSLLPIRIQAMGILIGRLIIQKNASVADRIQTVFTTTFTSNNSQSASDLSNGTTGTGAIVLQDGATVTNFSASTLTATTIYGAYSGTSINTAFTDAKIKGSVGATAGLIPFGTGVADTITSNTNFSFNGSALLVGTTALTNSTNVADFVLNQNAGTRVMSINTTNSALSFASIGASNSSSLATSVALASTPASYTPVGMLSADTGHLISSKAGGLNIGTSVSTDYRFYTNSVLRQTITSAGLVGINVTPSLRLHVSETSSASVNETMRVALAAGGTDAETYVTSQMYNVAAGTGTNLELASTFSNPVANAGLNIFTHATTIGYNVGGYYEALNGNLNVGVIGKAITNKSNATNIGVIGVANQTTGTPIRIGGYFALGGNDNSVTGFTSSALIATNGSLASNIFTAYDDTTLKFIINDGGQITNGSQTLGTEQINFTGNTILQNVTATTLSADIIVVQKRNYNILTPSTASTSTTINWANSNMFDYLLSAATTFTFSNVLSGQTIVVAIHQPYDGTVGFNYAFTGSTVYWPGGTTPTATTTTGKTDIYTFISMSGNTVYGSGLVNF